MDLNQPTLESIVKKKFPYNVDEVSDAYVKFFEFLGLKEEASIDSFLKPSLKLFNHPFLMQDMEKAVDVLIDYLDQNKKILFWGDYDADGATTTALFVSVLKKKGYTNIDWYVPHRHKDGYGINADTLKGLQSGYDLVVSGDTGIKEMQTIFDTPVPFIVTDHHEPVVSHDEEELANYKDFSTIIESNGEFMAIPDCLAVVNPKRIDCAYPNKWLSGVAVIYKMMQGIFIKKGWDQMELIPYLDLVALGLVADVVPQIDIEHQDLEIRMMTAVGLKMMNDEPRLWVQTFKEITGISEVRFSDLGFNFGPRINAAGRLDSADPAVQFLLEEEDYEFSLELGHALENSNKLRKELQKKATDSAVEQLSLLPPAFYEHIVVVQMDEEFHSGIAGLVASSLSNRYNVPAVVLCHKDINSVSHLSGSCRSIEGVSILDILIDTEKKLGTYKYGGHDAAAGLTIKESEFDLFRDIVIGIASALPSSSGAKKLFYDIEIPISAINVDLIRMIEDSFHRVRLFSPENNLYSPPGARKKLHGLLFLEKNNKKYEAITFNRAEELLQDFLYAKKEKADVVYTVSLYQNRPSIALDNWKFV